MNRPHYVVVAVLGVICGPVPISAICLQTDPVSGGLAEALRIVSLVAILGAPFLCGVFIDWWGWRSATVYSLIQVTASGFVLCLFGGGFQDPRVIPAWLAATILLWSTGRALRWSRKRGYL